MASAPPRNKNSVGAVAQRAEQVRLLYASLPGAISASALVAAALAFMLRNEIAAGPMLAWLVALALALLQGAVISVARRRTPPGRVDDRTWLLHFRVGVGATGAVWGLASLWLFPDRVADQTLLVVVVVGVTAGALTSLAVDFVCAALFTLPALVPLIVRLLLTGDQIIIAVALMLLVFLVFIAMSALRSYHSAMENLQLREAGVERERKLRRSEELLEHAGQLAEVGGWEFELASNSLSWTAETVRIHGLAPGTEPSLESATAHYPAPHRVIIETAVQQAAEHGTPFDLELPLVTSDGRSIWVRAMGRPRREGGEIVGVNGAFQDISARKFNEHALVAAREAAERANRAKSRFLSHMSHELRTPMNAVLGFAEILESDKKQPLSVEQADSVQHILRAGRHLLELIGELLDMAGVEQGKLRITLEPINALTLIDDCVSLMQPLARKRGIRVDHATQGLPTALVMADRTRLHQVLLNLLSNAIKFNRDHGSVRIDCAVQGETICIAVRDSGPGLSPAQQQRLFKPFERLAADAAAIEGTGIGLALSKQLVELMGGEIGMTGEVGVGCTFWVRLPLAAAAGAPAPSLPTVPTVPSVPSSPALATPQPSVPEDARTVLYIEASEFNTVLMRKILARRPALKLITAALPVDGVAMAQTQCPDLILLDMQLPDMDGLEVLRMLRAHDATALIPVIAVSGDATPHGSREARAGFAAYLTKPLDPAQLWAALDRELSRSSKDFLR